MVQDLKTMFGHLNWWIENSNDLSNFDLKERSGKLKTLFKVIVFFHLIILLFFGSIIFYYKYNNPTWSLLMWYRANANNYKIQPLKFIPLNKMPSDISKMVISIEDHKFYRHHGVDIEAIKRAMIINYKVGYRMYGASTITQQLARTLFLLPYKSFFRKYIELLITFELELILDKNRILELYLNYCEMGKGVFGIESGSYYHFGKSIYKLTSDQKSRLLAILANPVKYRPYHFSKSKLITNRYYILKFRYFIYNKFKLSQHYAKEYSQKE